jgi:hypothetical protein
MLEALGWFSSIEKQNKKQTYKKTLDHENRGKCGSYNKEILLYVGFCLSSSLGKGSEFNGVPIPIPHWDPYK